MYFPNKYTKNTTVLKVPVLLFRTFTFLAPLKHDLVPEIAPNRWLSLPSVGSFTFLKRHCSVLEIQLQYLQSSAIMSLHSLPQSCQFVVELDK